MESSSNIGSSSNCESEATNESSSENCREDEEIIIIPVDEIDENEEKGKEVGQAVEMELFNKWKSKDVETRIDTSHLPTFPIEFKRLDASKSSSTNNTNNSSNSNSSLLTKSYSKNAAERLVIPANHPTPPPGSLYASIRQQKNPVLPFVKNVKIEFRQDITPDYIFGKDMCALYIGVKYHNANPNYLEGRMITLKNMFSLRVLICLVDIEEIQQPLLDLSLLCLKYNFTQILCFSYEEAARYLELYRVYYNKSANSIKTKVEDNYNAQMLDILTTVRSINKTDVASLISNFGNLHGIANAKLEELSMIGGFGEKKIKRLFQAFNAPFIPPKSNTTKYKQTTIDFSQNSSTSQ